MKGRSAGVALLLLLHVCHISSDSVAELGAVGEGCGADSPVIAGTQVDVHGQPCARGKEMGASMSKRAQPSGSVQETELGEGCGQVESLGEGLSLPVGLENFAG